MGVNRGKQFEEIVKEGFERVPMLSIDRIPDQMSGRKGSTNICDFVAYKLPYIYYLECKTTYGNTLPFSNITDNQWKGLLNKSHYPGVFAGIICWWIDRDVTLYIPIETLQTMKMNGCKSIRYDIGMETSLEVYRIDSIKKRVFCEYDFNDLVDRLSDSRRKTNGRHS